MHRKKLVKELKQARAYIAVCAHSIRMNSEDRNKVLRAYEHIEKVLDKVTFKEVNG